ncbi:hypothetical protein PP175_29435 (plasmid) [Aneurinibacillus sp. Ricciae_BoGa-3]|uniref:AbrB/MazE/SpoVT family DNA-binding domain-containing protein n=1 Tax=Aneurinibacillus sp. Ricciae_BoGa-3 TaxID=3022697 RepID=UPI0023412CD6|nr:hypothetical protein [Aneurinibacillus sp. Ricciae_BoGa-3]WCK57315.1 hypothetical protein PP175_29435 [Aneurinibacillus sp. Ricciae_BoGa-3]
MKYYFQTPKTTWETAKEKFSNLKATITGKRQITIPKEISDIYGLQNGDHILFRQIGNHTVFEPEGYTKPCPACEGTTQLDDKECFVCRGVGTLQIDYVRVHLLMMGHIAMTAFNYKIYIEYGLQKLDEEGNTPPFPVLNLRSDFYSKEVVDRVRDLVQYGIIQDYVGDTKSIINKEMMPIFKKHLIDNLRTNEYKQLAEEWLQTF